MRSHNPRYVVFAILIMHSHLPVSLVASFIKRLSRLSLSAPPAAIVAIVPFVYNLLKRHPACMVLIHRGEEEDREADDFVGAFAIRALHRSRRTYGAAQIHLTRENPTRYRRTPSTRRYGNSRPYAYIISIRPRRSREYYKRLSPSPSTTSTTLLINPGRRRVSLSLGRLRFSS